MKRMHLTRSALVGLVVALGTMTLAATAFADGRTHHELATARAATAPFHHLSRAQAAGYEVVVQDLQGNTCIAEPGLGAMGVHYLNPELLDDAIEAAAPELVVYEPDRHGRLRLVALEYLTIKSVWDASHSEPPSLYGQEFMVTGADNRFGLPPYYSLHAWIWKHNPSGIFEMWNPDVTCP